MEKILEQSQWYEMLYHILKLVGAQECNYHFHPHTVMNSDVLILMSVESDGKWVVCMVANDVPRFRFWASSDDTDLMGEDYRKKSGIIINFNQRHWWGSTPAPLVSLIIIDYNYVYFFLQQL